jgi:hypothetical protein
MIHGNFSQEVMKSGSPIGRLAAFPLVLVNEQDSIPGPSEGCGKIRQGVLTFPRFDVIEDLLGIGLANEDDCQPVEVPIIERRWPQAEAGRHPLGDCPFAGCSGRGPMGFVRYVHCLPLGRLEALRAAGPRSD